jgi:hypothetical protein
MLSPNHKTSCRSWHQRDEKNSSRFDANLQSTTGAHLIQSLLVILKFEGVGDHAFRFDFAGIKIRNSAREAVGLRE